MKPLVTSGGAIMMLALLVMSPSSAIALSDRESAGLVGPVKSVTIESSSTDPGVVKEHWTWTFNESGLRVSVKSAVDLPQGASPVRMERVQTKAVTNNQVEEKVVDENGVLLKRIVTVLDAQGRMLESVEHSANAAVLTRTTVEYEKDTLKTLSFYSMGKLLYRRADTLNRSGNVIESHKYRADGTLESHEQFNLKEDGKVLEERSFGSNGELIRRATYAYDAKGNEIEQVVFDSDNIPLSKRVSKYEYDASGNWIKQEITESVIGNGKIVSSTRHLRRRTILYYQ
jgi:hypothetical protein